MELSKRVLLIPVAGLLLAFASVANAVPTLFFDGDTGALSYTAATGALDVNARLIGFEDINPDPILDGSSLALGALFTGLGADSSAVLTVGQFTGGAGTDLSIVGGDATVLLEAELTSLQMRGANGSDFGVMIAMLTATGGSLVSTFAGSELFALQLNLSSSFANDMFRADFIGSIDGNLKAVAVPEPSLMAILATGLVLIGLVMARKSDAVWSEDKA